MLSVRKVLEDNNSPEAIFETDDERTYFISTFLINAEFEEELNGELNGELNKRQKLVLEKIKSMPGINAKTLSKDLNIPFSTIDKYIRFFSEKNIVERKGSRKTGGYYAKK